MKTSVLLLCVVWSEISFSKSSDLHDKSDNLQPKKNVNFYEFSVLNAAGELIALDKFKGKVINSDKHVQMMSHNYVYCLNVNNMLNCSIFFFNY